MPFWLKRLVGNFYLTFAKNLWNSVKQGQPVEEASEEKLQRDAQVHCYLIVNNIFSYVDENYPFQVWLISLEYFQTIVNCLADGTFIDAIMSVERKTSVSEVPPDEDMAIKTIDVSQSPQPTDGSRKGKRTPGSRRTFLCDICGFGCTSRQTLNTHYAYKHGSLMMLSLKICTNLVLKLNFPWKCLTFQAAFGQILYSVTYATIGATYLRS